MQAFPWFQYKMFHQEMIVLRLATWHQDSREYKHSSGGGGDEPDDRQELLLTNGKQPQISA